MAEDKGRGGGARGKRKPRNMGRAQWRYFAWSTAVTWIHATNQGSRSNADKRANVEERTEAKRRKIEAGEAQAPIYATEFSKEEIENEERRPKKKVAVLLGYSGTGYYGMQLYVILGACTILYRLDMLTMTIQK